MGVRSLLLLAVLGLSACRAPLEPRPFDSRAQEVRQVAVLPIHHDVSLVFEYANDQLETLNRLVPGPLGSALAAAVGAAGRSGFNEALGLAPAGQAQRATASLVDSLRRAGYAARPVPRERLPERPERRGGLLTALPPDVAGEADAVLDGYLELGFVAAGRGEPYRPMAWLTLRAWRPDGRVLLEDRIMYNAGTSDDGDVFALRGIRLPMPAWLEFEDAEQILAGDEAGSALAYAVDRVLAEARFLFRGPWL